MTKRKIPTSVSGYEDMLVRMIEARTGAEFDEFLLPQVSACAQVWQIMRRVHKDLMDAKALVEPVKGSTGQYKNEPSPLLPYYLKLSAEHRLQLGALGLNYSATPSKIKEDTKKGADPEKDGLARLLREAKDATVGITDLPL